MDDLVERVSTAANIEPEAARKAVGLILHFLMQEGPEPHVNAVIDAIPGARAALSGAAVEEDGSTVLSGLTGGGGGLMGLAGQLSGLGLGMDEMQTVGRTVLGYARERAGEDAVGEIAGAIPGLHQLM
ncbi:DUF2267 domain-containing protein [Lichenihabitans sp. Uapishka_5]|uniref:DUF2267 domain-containing protein n=1 Tax=Lichenihabitans sp. Uapishka_5 TaxID=3037302 RepID=UPI0029E7FC19|nr:DUF2267 domain-containing protein [Lichenihabitans sp. Uapishka_5]MDX7951585.1 DUF2267 domain-containing protein [Lichenihabitans sp. Uapishka_5]